MINRLFVSVLVLCLGLAARGAADNRPTVYFSVTRLADEDTKVDSWVAIGGKFPIADDMLHGWGWGPRYGKPFFAVVDPVTVSDFAIFAVKFYWDVSQADVSRRNVHYVEVKWDTPTPFTFEGRQFVLFASLKSLDYVKENSYPKRTPFPVR